MRNYPWAAAALALAAGAGAAGAGGIDRSGQNIGLIWEKGDYAEFSLGYVAPSVGGPDLLGGDTGNVTHAYTMLSGGFRKQVNDRVAIGLIVDHPFGADVEYGLGSTLLGGTTVEANSIGFTAIGQYRLSDRFSVHGGLRYDIADARIHLQGLAYDALSDYTLSLDRNGAPGYLIGAAYEIPEIALRVALTYNSKITHTFDTVESDPSFGGVFSTTPTKVSTPQSVNLDFQTGVAKDTLIFGQVRWAEWSAFKLDPDGFVGFVDSGLISLEDTITYTLGVGRKFNDRWSGALSVVYEPGGDPLVSPLAPTNGRLGVSLAGIYTHENMKITAGINYTELGDASPETGTPDIARANFTGGSALGIGIKIGFTF